ncbi:hypothetical protein ACFL20_11095 [Spirochaetota bacterium]
MRVQNRTDILLDILKWGLIELRMLCWYGKVEQILALTQAMHNVPDYIARPESWKLSYFIREFSHYDAQYPIQREIQLEQFRDYDYVAMLRKLENDSGDLPWTDTNT